MRNRGFYFAVTSRALKRIIYFACVLVLLGVAGWGLCLYDHAKQVSIKDREVVDSLNDLSYDYCFRQLDSAYVYAHKALKSAKNYNSGMCEALNNLMFICYLRMNYEDGYHYYCKIQNSTKNQIQLLISEINMMKLCQQTSENRQFFDYYNRALQRMGRIMEEYNTLDERNKKNFAYAQIEFRLTAASNYYFLMQTAQAIHEINLVPEEGDVRNDLVQWIYYCYLRGLGRLFDGVTYDERLLKSFDYLMIAHQTSLQYHYIFFEARSLQILATMLDNDYNFTLIKKERPHVITYLENAYVKNSSEVAEQSGKRNEALIMALVDEGLKYSKTYNSILLTGRAYYTLGCVRFNRGEYSLALDAFETSLSYINLHHRQCYPDDRGPFLSLYSRDSVAVEMKWIANPHTKTLPVMLASIRERLSATFSALDDKQKSDYNRNLYLDLLEIARQDKSLESKYEHLVQSNKLLMTVTLVVAVIMVIAWISLFLFARLWKRRNNIRISLLNSLHDWFSNMPDESPILRLEEVIKSYPWMRREKKVMQDMLLPYMDWIEKNRSLTAEIQDDVEQIKEERMLSEYRIEDNKRKNISKRAKVTLVNSIMPYVDRILNEVHRILKTKDSIPQRLAYVEEITDKINDCNDILTQWIQMHRGEVNLSIETFPLQQLFDIIKKGNYNFVQKNIMLDVRPTACWVKADKALTLFMINTLADNARKFTPSGGFVRIEANEQDGAVEISVTDTGCGLTDEEISLILSSKIYDASLIGEKTDQIQNEKGHGFGLMNCKGIIEKYKKLNKIFEVCRFDIQSKKGEGSRFFFRLPKGDHFSKITVIFLMLCSSLSVFSSGYKSDKCFLLNQAAQLADSVYFSNISGDHSKAIVYADSALSCINRYYEPFLPPTCRERQLKLEGYGWGEQEWWNEGIKADYNLIMALRNEVAVAALALHLWDLYTYNNLLYTHMYRLNSQNNHLESELMALIRLQKNMNMGVVFMIIIILILIVLIYIIYFRRRMMFRFNVMQVLDINHSIFESANHYNRQTQIDVMTKDWLEILLKGINEIHEIEGVVLYLCKENEQCIGIYAEGAIQHFELTKTLLKNVYYKRNSSYDEMINTKAYPLLFHHDANKTVCVGSLAINYGKYQQTRNEAVFEEFIVSYLSIMIYEVIVRRGQQWEMLEMENDERQRALYEETRLRVQNQIMDNCLSTIKHEAMYYPSRIKQIVRRIRETDNAEDVMRQLYTLNELAEYYKEIYMLLASQLERQLSFIYFKFTDVDVKYLMDLWVKKTQNYISRKKLSVSFDSESAENSSVITDEVLADFLLKNMTIFCLDRLAEKCLPADLKLSTVVEDNFIKFMLYLSVELYTPEETAELFDSEQGNYPLLICKEIIRIHDKLNNYCGCRINIETMPEHGTCVWFTIPKSEKKYDKTI